MFYFITEFMVIVLYLFNDIYGMLFSFCLFCYIFSKKNFSFFDKILTSSIMSLPLFNIGFAGKNMPHIFSWSTIFIVLLIIYLINNFIKSKISVSKKSLFLISIFITIPLVHCFFEVNFKNSLIEWCQLLLMVIPIYLVYIERLELSNKINFHEKYIDRINSVLLATSFAVFFQYFMYNRFGIMVGEWTFYSGRTKIDLLFKGSSVLSMFIGMGIPLNVVKFLEKYDIKYLFFVIICFLGIIINSARTGLVAGLLASILPIIKSLKYKKSFFIIVLFTPIMVFSLVYGINYMLESRGSSNLIEENGRNETYKNGINLIVSSPRIVLFGNGLSLDNYNQVMPHNLFLESWLTMGLICLIIIIFYLKRLLFEVKKYKYKYILWEIIISSMFITNFTGNIFATVMFCIMLLLANYVNISDNDERMVLNEKKVFNNSSNI